MAAKMALGIIRASVAAADRLHDWRTRRLTAAPRSAFGSHVTFLTNPDTDLSTARVVTYTTPDKHSGVRLDVNTSVRPTV